MKELIESYFNMVYDDTYNEVMAYVVARCSDINYVEDILQDTYAEFFSIINKKGKSYVKSPISLIKKIAKIKVFRYYKLKSQLNRQVSLQREDKSDKEIIDPRYQDIEKRYINSYTAKEVWRQIALSHPDIQKIFVLHYYMDKTIKQISGIMNLSESNIKHKLYRTIDSLRKIYKREDFLL
ncbi:MAG: RNA polymerase sigma factor [Bacillota bacterium]